MSFPYTYSDSLTISKPNLTSKELKHIIINELITTRIFKNYQTDKFGLLKSNSPFLKLPFQIKLDVKDTEVKYIIHLDQLIRIILAVIIFSALFSYTSLSFFFWFASLFSVLFYLLNLLIINGYVNSSVSDILEKYNLKSVNKEVLSEEQEKWLNDKNRCPACGTYLSEIDLTCPECGLHLKRSRHTIPLDTSNYKNEPIHYRYKE